MLELSPLVTDANASKSPFPPNGGLSGGATLINVLTGDAFTEDATALVQFTTAAVYSNTGVNTPDFTSGTFNWTAMIIGLVVTGLIVFFNFKERRNQQEQNEYIRVAEFGVGIPVAPDQQHPAERRLQHG